MALQIISCLLLLLVSIKGTTGIKGRFVQINDVHHDPTYSSTGDSCNEVVPNEKRLPYGNYDCDASLVLTESAFYKVDQESSISNTDFIVWAGDIVTHVRNSSFLNEEKLVNIVNTTSYLMAERVKSGVPIFPMLGNHDYFPKNQLPGDPSSDRLYGKLADILCPLFIKESCTLFRQAGYYSKVLEGKLRVIILNTNLYLTQNHAVRDGEADPANQFEWLREELEKTKSLNQKAHVFAHVAPGFLETAKNVIFFKEDYNRIFTQILRDFADVIIGVYSGHTHTDSFRVIYSKESPKRPMVSMLIAPAVSPWRWVGPKGPALARNPALRAVSYEASQPHKLKEYVQFFLRLDKANDPNNKETVEWQNEYHFTRHYTGVSDLTPQSLHNLVTNFRKMGSEDFHKYFNLNSVSIHLNEDKPVGGYYCGGACKERHICTIENVNVDPYKACLVDVNRAGTGCHFVSTLWLPMIAFLVVMKQLYV